MKSNNGIGYICISWGCCNKVEVMNSRCSANCPKEDKPFEEVYGLCLYFEKDNPLTHLPRDRTKDREQVKKENSNAN